MANDRIELAQFQMSWTGVALGSASLQKVHILASQCRRAKSGRLSRWRGGGNARAKEKLYTAYLGRILEQAFRVHRRFCPSCVQLDDMVFAGILGFEKALRTLDLRRGTRVSANWRWVTRALLRSAIHDTFPVRIPNYKYEEFGELPSRLKAGDTTALACLSDSDRTALGMIWGFNLYSLNDLNEEEEPGVSFDLDGPLYSKWLLTKLLSPLSERQRQVILLRFSVDDSCGEEPTLESVGRHLGVTRERVRQIELQAKRKLQSYWS